MAIPVLSLFFGKDAGDEPGTRAYPEARAYTNDKPSAIADPYAALFERLQTGDASAFNTIYLDHFQALVDFACSYARRIDAAEDIVQDVFRRMWDGRATLVVRGTVRGYLYGAVRHGALNYRRHEQVTQRAAAAGDVASAGMSERMGAPDELLELDEASAQIARALAAMPEERRRVLALRWRHGLSYAEIAATLGVSEQAVRAQVSRAGRLLRAIIGE